MSIQCRALLRKYRSLVESSNLGYRLSLLIQHKATGPHGVPNAPWHNAVLKNQHEVNKSINQVLELGLPATSYPAKNWDSLAALDLILKNTSKRARIFDAGGELYSMILPWLFLYGYRNLEAGNLVFQQPVKKGPIIYKQLDITKSCLDSSAYDAVTCLSDCYFHTRCRKRLIQDGIDLIAPYRSIYTTRLHAGILSILLDKEVTFIDNTYGKNSDFFKTWLKDTDGVTLWKEA